MALNDLELYNNETTNQSENHVQDFDNDRTFLKWKLKDMENDPAQRKLAQKIMNNMENMSIDEIWGMINNAQITKAKDGRSNQRPTKHFGYRA